MINMDKDVLEFTKEKVKQVLDNKGDIELQVGKTKRVELVKQDNNIYLIYKGLIQVSYSLSRTEIMLYTETNERNIAERILIDTFEHSIQQLIKGKIKVIRG